MATLDGKEPVTPTPFDAHEQVVRGTHTHSAKEGYVKAETPAEPVPYPRVVAHDKETGATIIVNSAEEEKAHQEAKNDVA